MKNKIISLLVASMLAISTLSCDGFLDKYPSDSIDVDLSIGTVGAAKVALNGTYRRMTSLSYYGRNMIVYAEFKGADFGVTTTGISGEQLYYFTHTPTSGTYSDMWNQGYDIILQANNILERIDSGDIIVMSATEQRTLDLYKGQALAIRALVHFDMTRLYGYPYLKDNGAGLGAPIVKQRLIATDKLKRETVAKCYEEVITDLTDAIALMSSSTARTIGEFNLYAVRSLLARVYLHKGDWENAYIQAKNVIDNGGYIPYTANNWIASWSQQGATESILELWMRPSEGDLGSSSLRAWYAPRNTSRRDLGPMMVSDMFLDMFSAPDHANDVRWGLLDLDEFSNGLSAGADRLPNRKGWLKKYENDGKSPASAVNIKVIRLTEVMLIAAEAAVRKPVQDKANAAAWINTIRERNPDMAATPLTATTADNVLLAEIELQRRIDLLGEGHRYFDVLRNGGTVTYKDGGGVFNDIPNGGRASTVDWNFHKCVLPIGINEINANPEIATQQNPGY